MCMILMFWIFNIFLDHHRTGKKGGLLWARILCFTRRGMGKFIQAHIFCLLFQKQFLTSWVSCSYGFLFIGKLINWLTLCCDQLLNWFVGQRINDFPAAVPTWVPFECNIFFHVINFEANWISWLFGCMILYEFKDVLKSLRLNLSDLIVPRASNKERR